MPGEIVVADEILDGTDVVGQLFGKRQGFAHQTGNALSQGIVETFNVIGFPSVLGDGLVSSRWDYALIGVIVIRMEPGLFTVHHRDLGPQRCGTVPTAIADVKRHDLVGGGVHGDPNPLPVAFLCTKLHSSSASASSCRRTTSVGLLGS
jgi:hypothetical protein